MFLDQQALFIAAEVLEDEIQTNKKLPLALVAERIIEAYFSAANISSVTVDINKRLPS